MTDEYLWDGSGEPEAFVDRLERGLSPLGDELDAMLDELDELEGGELDEPPAIEDEAVVLQLPVANAAEPRRTRPRSSWLWMSAAAVLLLSFSTFALSGRGQSRGPSPAAQVVGEGAETARLTLAVTAVETDAGASSLDALRELRAVHDSLARCSIELEAGAQLELHVELRAEAIELRRATFGDGELDRTTRRCLDRALARWQPEGLGLGELGVRIEIE